MDLRRVLLVLAILLLVAAGAASLAPPAEEESDTGPTAPATTGPAETGTAGDEPVEVDFAVDAPPKDRSDRAGKAGRAEEVSVDRGARVVATISVPSPGEVELEGLGRVAPAEPGTPAVFDLLADRPGTYEAVFTPTEGPARTAGALVVGGKGDGGDESGGGKARSRSSHDRHGGT